jgi:hypothetical protein
VMKDLFKFHQISLPNAKISTMLAIRRKVSLIEEWNCLAIDEWYGVNVRSVQVHGKRR